MFLSDVFVNYNIATEVITCKGIQISNIINSPLILSKYTPPTMRLEEQTFVLFSNPKCKVNIYL